MDGLHVALLVGSVGAVVAAVAVALLLPRRTQRHDRRKLSEVIAD